MSVAEVRIWGERVGAVKWDSATGIADFAYEPAFRRTGIELSPLMMPVTEQIYRFPRLGDSNTFKGLPGLLADSLPEKYGNKLLATWLANRGQSLNDLDPVARLCFLGSRGMGALEFLPDTDSIVLLDNKVDIDGLISVAKEVMDHHNQKMTYDPENPNIERLIQIGTSAGGAKAKALIAFNRDTKEVMSGLGEVPAGFIHYLMKFSGVDNDETDSDRDVGRMEMAYHLMAVEAGIRMMESELIYSKDGIAHFMTRRFDRDTSGNKFHVQTYCAIAHQDRDPVGMCSYEHLFSTARKLGIGQDGINELYRRMVFNILARNQDDHTKNHAFILNAGKWEVTPAYDLCFAYKKDSRWISMHQMQCNGKRDEFTREDLLASAIHANIRNPEKIIRDVQEALGYWAVIANDVGLPVDKANSIARYFRMIN